MTFFGKFWFNIANSSCPDFKNEVYYIGASTIILSKDIDKYAFICGSNFYETDTTYIQNMS